MLSNPLSRHWTVVLNVAIGIVLKRSKPRQQILAYSFGDHFFLTILGRFADLVLQLQEETDDDFLKSLKQYFILAEELTPNSADSIGTLAVFVKTVIDQNAFSEFDVMKKVFKAAKIRKMARVCSIIESSHPDFAVPAEVNTHIDRLIDWLIASSEILQFSFSPSPPPNRLTSVFYSVSSLVNLAMMMSWSERNSLRHFFSLCKLTRKSSLAAFSCGNFCSL